MSNNRDQKEQKLEHMLRSRQVEPASPDLAERIILRAQRMPQNQTLTLTQWMQRLCAEFYLPRPVYVVASTLIFGFVLGLNTPLYTTVDDADPIHVQSFLYADEDLP